MPECPRCSGIWLDQNEWELLKTKGLHDDIHYIFTEAWQSRIKREEELQKKRNILLHKIGDTDFSKVDNFKNWLAEHDHKDMITAYLLQKEK